MKGFRDFLMRGNVVDLAVAVVIGAAFGAVISAFVKDLLTPLIAAVFGKPDFSALSFELNGSRFLYGEFINALLAFVLIAAAVYYVVVLPLTAYMERRRRGEVKDPTTRQCPECLGDVPVGARRCMYCTSSLAALPVPQKIAS